MGRRVPGGQMGERWEFPGGKVEKDELPEEAICREFDEEFSVPVSVGNKIAQAVFQYKGNDIQLEDLYKNFNSVFFVAFHKITSFLFTNF